jgi:hypothetical protein
LRERLGATRLVRPQLPVIPLGVEVERFAQGERAEALRRTRRAALGIAADDVAFLFMGRLSYHAKAHPLPMFLALEAAAQRTKQRVHLILAGWFANPTLETRFLQGAASYAPSVKIKLVDGRREEIRNEIWHAADVFTSLADNIQETFGLTPIEAMAAGLPVVISDWNGYRDTVRHGLDGFLVPTYQPPAGLGQEIAGRFAARADSYDRYIAQTSQCTAVDIGACVEVYTQLIEQPELRRRLGEAGRGRAREVFAWKHVIKAYQDLWRELEEMRRSPVTEPRERPRFHPLRDDPWAVFAHYATHLLTDDFRVRLAQTDAAKRLPMLYGDPLVNYAGAPVALAGLAECAELLTLLTAGERTVGELAAAFPLARRGAVVRSVGWLLKVGLVVSA